MLNAKMLSANTERKMAERPAGALPVGGRQERVVSLL
jgi:hypothetical protein